MEIVKLTEQNYSTTNWSGGTTTQLIIYPSTATVANQDFTYRISTAVVNGDSTFTKYNNYTRFITTLDNEITLNNDTILTPLNVHKFSGEETTTSIGSCTDFNLICSKELSSNMVVEKESYSKVYSGYNHYIFYSSNDACLMIENKAYYLKPKEALIVYNDKFSVDVDISEGYVISFMIKV